MKYGLYKGMFEIKFNCHNQTNYKIKTKII